MTNNYGVDIADDDTGEETNLSNIELFKLVAPFFKKYTKVVLFAILLLPFGALASSVQPIIIQKAIDGPLRELDMAGLTPFVLVMVAAVIFHFIVQIFQVYITNHIGQKVIADIRLKLFSHLEKLPMAFFDKNPIGKTVTRITNDMENLGESFTGGIIGSLADTINIIAIAIFMFYLNWKLSIAVLLMLLPMIFMAKYFQSMYRKANLRARKELSKLNSFLQQNIVGISVVQLLNSSEKNMRIFDEHNTEFVKANDKTIKADSSFSAGIEFISISATALLIYMSNEMILHEALSIGVVIAFLQYAQTLFEPIRNLSDKFTTIQAGFTSAERISHLLNEPITIKDPITNQDSFQGLHERGLLERVSGVYSNLNEHREPERNKAHGATGNYQIDFKNIWFRYKDELILKGVNFTIKAGEKVAIVGKTGAGKSTIIKLLTRLYEPQKGEILINGVNIKDIKQAELRELIAVIHQDSYIFAGDVESNINLKRDTNKLDFDLAKPFLAASSLKPKQELSERASNISSGESQVISFARAVVTNPPILVLDEATAKIDLKTEKTIQLALAKFMQGRTNIIIAHRLETIKKMDRILVLNEGLIAETGSHDELIKQAGIYADLYKNK